MTVSRGYFNSIHPTFDSDLENVSTDRLVAALINRGASCETVGEYGAKTIQNIIGPKIILLVNVDCPDENDDE